MHDDPLGVGCADVVEQVVRAARCSAANRSIVRCTIAGHGAGRTGWRPRGPGRRRRGSAPCRAGPGGRARARARGARGPASSSISAAHVVVVERLDLVRSRARCGSRRRSAGTGPATRASPRGRPAAKSCASCTRAGGQHAPSRSARAAITSLWSPKIDSAWVATVRAATWMTAGVSSPAILYMFGIISSRPCDAVNVVASAPACSAPWTAPAAPASLCISTTVGTVPQRFGPASGRPLRRRARPSATTGVIG